jgi:uncharacterized membrane protein
MKNIVEFLKTTLLGGLLFLVPIVLLALVASTALDIVDDIVEPLAVLIPVESVGGIEVAKLLAGAAIVLFCFFAGLLGQTALAKQLVDWLESAVLSNLPGYEVIKSMGESMVGIERNQAHQAVLARIEEAWQIAFLVERIDGGYVAVFVPDAPNPWSGSVFFMTEDRIRSLDLPRAQLLKCLNRLGVGSNSLLAGRL